MSLISENQVEMILYVQNMHAEVRFYRDVLGLTLHYPQGLKDYSDQMWVEFEVGNTLLALHGGASNQPDTRHEIVFWVENVAQAREMIVAAGIEMNEIRDLEDGAPIAEGKDPDGHRFAIRSD